jgi:predicted nucleotidyltransferase
MDRTALVLTRDEWQAYHPGARVDQELVAARWERAWQVARGAAEILRRQFGATQVIVFGSLACRECFSPWSDIDLAALGIPPDLFYRAVAAVTGISSEFKIDLVAPEDCQPTLRQAIEREGIIL